MQNRVNLGKALPAIYKTVATTDELATQAAIDAGWSAGFTHLVKMRASQINGCAFCLEMHSKALRKSGVAQAKLDALAGWRVSHHFSEQERAALAWAESVTHIASTHAEDDVYLPLLDHFSAKEISDLTFAISLMNCFNRLAVGMRM